MTETTEKKPKKRLSKKRIFLWSSVILLAGGIGVGTFYAGPQVQNYMKQLAHPIPAPEVLPVPEQMIPVHQCEEQRIILLESQQEIKEACDADILLLQNENKRLQQEITFLHEQLESLRAAPQKETTTQALRLMDLLQQIEQGRPFAAFLSDMLKAFPRNTFLKKIETELGYAAAVGIPTITQIQASFKEDFTHYEETILLTEKEQQTWYGSLWAKLRTLIRVRPVTIQNDTACPRLLLYKASDEIARGQIGMALVSLRQMPEEKRIVFIPLMKQIESRLKAENLIMGEHK